MSHEDNHTEEPDRGPRAETPQAAPHPGEPAAEAEPELAGSHALAQALRTSFFFLRLALIALVAGYLLYGLFTVKPAEVRFKLRFGQLVKVMRPGSGIQFRWPWEQVEVVSTEERSLDLEEDFWTAGEAGGLGDVTSLDMRRHGHLISRDRSIIHMEPPARYRVRDDAEGAIAYRFAVGNAQEVLRHALRAATCKVVGSMEVMPLIKRTGLFPRIENETRARLDQFERQAGMPLGIELRTVEPIQTEKAKNPTEPGAVSDAFFEAQDAASLYSERIQEGKTEARKMKNDAEATRAEILAAARGYRERLVRNAKADADTLNRLLPLCEDSPGVRRILVHWFYARAIEELMESSPGSIVLHKADEGADRELRIMLERQSQGTEEGG